MPLLDYDYSAYSSNIPKRVTRDNTRNMNKYRQHSNDTYGDLALKPKKKAVFDQDRAKMWMRSPYEIEEDRYEDDFRRIEERVEKSRRQSFDYEMEAKMSMNKKSYSQMPEAIDLEETEESVEEKKALKKERTEKVFNSITNVFLFISIACIALFICYRYSLINEKFNEVEKAKKRLVTAQTVNEQLQADIDSETDISYIENYAKYQLGMQKPQQSQMVYINVEKEDKIFTPVKLDDESTEKLWLNNIIENLANLFE